jgi:hypothetical protein
MHPVSQSGTGAFWYGTGSPYSGTGLVPASTFLFASFRPDRMPDSPAFRHLRKAIHKLILVVVKGGTPCTSILLAVEVDTPCKSILLPVKMDTPCTSILLAVEGDTFCTSILLVLERDTPCTSILLALEGDTPCMSILLVSVVVKGYPVHVQTAVKCKNYTVHFHRPLLMVLFLLLDVEKSYVNDGMLENVSSASAFLPIVSCFSTASAKKIAVA